MAKRFKFRISRVIPSFQSCRSKDPSNHTPSNAHKLPSSNLLNFHFSSTIFPSSISPAPPKPHHSTIQRHVSSAFISVGCGFRSRSPTLSDEEPTEFKWEKEDKWHVMAKVYNGDTNLRRKIYNSSVSRGSDPNDDELHQQPQQLLPPARGKKIKRRHHKSKKKKTTAPRIRLSPDSCDRDNNIVDDKELEETESLMSYCRSFLTDTSCEFSPHLETIHGDPTRQCETRRQRIKKGKSNNKQKQKSVCAKRGVSFVVSTKNNEKRYNWTLSSPETGCSSPARLSVFQRLIPCKVEGKVRESFAVVKKSEDPYEDFRRSMVEMIMEKEIFEEKELKQLLNCLLSLNSSQYHGVIVEAFSEIWKDLLSSQTNVP